MFPKNRKYPVFPEIILIICINPYQLLRSIGKINYHIFKHRPFCANFAICIISSLERAMTGRDATEVFRGMFGDTGMCELHRHQIDSIGTFSFSRLQELHLCAWDVNVHFLSLLYLLPYYSSTIFCFAFFALPCFTDATAIGKSDGVIERQIFKNPADCDGGGNTWGTTWPWYAVSCESH